MRIFGLGPPLVLIPGVQGRWEWMRPTIDALARSFRVATFSLRGERGSPAIGDDFDSHLEQVDDAVEALGAGPAVVMGVSFGGWVAVRYAALRPQSTRALVIVSTPGPGFTPHERHMKWIDAPRRSFPVFVMTSPGRVLPEVRTAVSGRTARLGFMTRHAWRAIVAPMSATRAAARVRQALAIDFAEAARRVQAPTLVITGEDGLDRLVPPVSTREYAGLIEGARVAHIERTGHIGSLTRPDRFVEIVDSFTRDLSHDRSHVA
jgi:pimeloyl-ACP methyl ester carboxylesterase